MPGLGAPGKAIQARKNVMIRVKYSHGRIVVIHRTDLSPELNLKTFKQASRWLFGKILKPGKPDHAKPFHRFFTVLERSP
jgi:hypothetical protein